MDEGSAQRPSEDQIAAVRAQLAAARSNGDSGAIGIAHLNLAMILGAAGDHATAVQEYEELISYLDLAQRDDEGEVKRWLSIGSLSSPVPDASNIPPAQLQAMARIQRSASLLMLGRRSEAAAELEAAQPACRGFGKGWLRKQWSMVRARMDQATEGVPETQASSGNVASQPSLTEQIAAADEMLGNESFAEAARIALRAIDQCGEEDIGYRAQCRQVLGIALEGLGQPDDAQAVLADAFSDYLQADEPTAAAQIAIPLAWRQAQTGELQQAISLLRQALRFTESAGEPQLRSQLFTDLGSLIDQDGDTKEARKAFEAGLATAEAIPDAELTANAQHGLAIVLAHAGSANRDDEVEALSLLESCRQTYETLGFRDRVAGCEHETAALLGRLGSLDAAQKRYDSALQLYRDLPEELRDTGSWPDEIADIERNLAALTRGQTSDPGLFASGGHAMSHSGQRE